jgi:hypothetical protein
MENKQECGPFPVVEARFFSRKLNVISVTSGDEPQ